MEFWTLEHASDATLFLFMFIIIGLIVIGFSLSLIDFIKSKIKKKINNKAEDSSLNTGVERQVDV